MLVRVEDGECRVQLCQDIRVAKRRELVWALVSVRIAAQMTKLQPQAKIAAQLQWA